MRTSIPYLLSTLGLLIHPAPAQAEDQAKIALHLKAHSGNVCASPPTIPCTQYVTAGRVGVSYDAYLVVAHVSLSGPYYSDGIGGLSCGIDYEPTPGNGADIYSWTRCADGLEWTQTGPNGDWPSAGSGNRLTWTTCQVNQIYPEGIHAVAGSFYVYAYGADQLQVTENRHLDSGPELKVARCSGSETYLPASSGGRVDFSPLGTSPGYNPCLNVEPVCTLPDVSISLGSVAVGAYEDAAFSIVNGGMGSGPLQGTVTENCPEFVVQSGGTFYLPEQRDTAVVQVRVAPLVPGPLSCLFHLGATCRDVYFEGTAVITPHPLLVPSSLNQTLPNGGSASIPFQVKNIGNPTLTWNTRVELGSLEDIENALNENASGVVALIPNRLIFEEGWLGGTYLEDVRIYSEAGNFLYTDKGGDFEYTEGAVRESRFCGRGGRYFATGYSGLYVFVGDFVGVDQFSVRGSLRQAIGTETVDRFTVQWNQTSYDVIVHRTWGNTDYPSVNHVFITADLDAAFQYDPLIRKEDATLSGLTRATRLFYLMYMGTSGGDIGIQKATEIVRAFLDAAHPYPQWATATALGGDIAPQDSSGGEVHVSTAGLDPGIYHARVAIPSNSLSLPAAILPVTMNFTLVPDIQLSASALDFDSVFVADQSQETLFVSNTGLARAEFDAQVNNPIFSLPYWDGSVHPGTLGKIVVQCSPESLGAFSGVLTLLINDPDEATVQIPLTGFAPPRPEMSFSPSAIVGTALPGGQARKALMVSNAGPAKLVFTTGSHAPWITVSPPGATLAPQASIGLEILLDARNLGFGDAESTLFISSNAEWNHREIPVTFHVAGLEAASIQVDPGTLNPGSHGRWVHAYVELPPGDSPEDLVLETVCVQNSVRAEPDGYAVGDFDLDGTPDVRFRFDRGEFIRALPPEDRVEVLVTGEIRDRHYFTAHDSVRVLRPRLLSPNGGERLLAGAFEDVRFDLDEVDDADSIVVSYSPDGGATWVPGGMTTGVDHVAWRVPEEASETGLLAVDAYRSGVLLGYDQTNAVFSISRSTTGIEPSPDLRTTVLLQNAPNPFSTATRIPYSLAASEEVLLEVFNVSGMRVRTLARGVLPSGWQEASWDGKDDTGRRMPPGLYVVRLKTPSVESSRRMFLVP